MNLNPLFPPSTEVIAFDADDTLWDCQIYFNEVERWYCHALQAYGSAESISASLYEVERSNMAELGYGSKAVIISLVENALRVSKGRLDNALLQRIIDKGRTLLRLPATPLPGVEDTLAWLKQHTTYRLLLFTKGDSLEQEQKAERSGLLPYFEEMVTVSDKDAQAYRQLCARCRIKPQQLLMVGNSMKSDIAPAVQIGAHAIYIPHHCTWQYEVMEPIRHPNVRELKELRELKESSR